MYLTGCILTLMGDDLSFCHHAIANLQRAVIEYVLIGYRYFIGRTVTGRDMHIEKASLGADILVLISFILPLIINSFIS